MGCEFEARQQDGECREAWLERLHYKWSKHNGHCSRFLRVVLRKAEVALGGANYMAAPVANEVSASGHLMGKRRATVASSGSLPPSGVLL